MTVTDRALGAAPALTHFAGRAGDHNDRAMVGSRLVAASFAARFGAEPVVIGQPQPALSVGWKEELAAALPALQEMSQRYEQLLGDGGVPVTALSRCAVALATLPRIAAHRPDAVVVWFDAHADINTPQTSETGYLGGLALSGPLGLWDSGLGSGLLPQNTILVGARDIDPPEQHLIDRGDIELVEVGPGLPEELRRAIGGRPVYVHLDCDVLEPGTVPTDYLVPGGLSLAQLHQAAEVLAESEIIGVEIGEFESPADAAPVAPLIDALEPVLQAVERPLNANRAGA
ncbi:arginase family protein [Saccharopolyspora elongata]|uniref:Arginase family protein n=1 Tax=Saccharopolyspora elongata TaxID=2530387 RepID=A0A4R4XXD9_9PSEU|nr:arginase family protein [Saccharopolyspora elongata]TDD36236.1 arginase family protein [Saccharopolyspora elongata]